MTITVFQVATGNVGSEMIKRIATRPDLRLVGVHCYSPEKIGRDTDRDRFMSAEEAKDFGIVDQVVQQRPPAPGGHKH